METETLGERLRKLRNARKLSLDELGAAAGVRGQAIWLVEKGRTKRFQPGTAKRVATALGVSQTYLEYGHEPTSNADESIELLSLYRNLDPPTRRTFLRIGEVLREQQTEHIGIQGEDRLEDDPLTSEEFEQGRRQGKLAADPIRDADRPESDEPA